jgi:FAD:protein FMN transferase
LQVDDPRVGTVVRAEVWHPDVAVAKAALEAVMAEMHRIDASMSPFRPESELSLMNREAANRPMPVSDELIDLLLTSIEVSRLSGGAFDVTFSSAGRHYDFRNGVRPDDETLSEGVAAIDYRHLAVDVDRRTVHYRHPGVHVDLGGIGKGHAVDRAMEILRAHGIEQGMVSAGGDSRILGDRHGAPWRVGIQDPRDPERVAVLLPLVDAAVSTSGDYERYFECDGIRFHHILDPQTGDSARSVRSASVIGTRATLTDALSTAIFVLGAADGLAMVDAIDGYDAIIIDAEGRLHVSSSLGFATP